jgi:autotransporter adhesin
LGSTSNAGGCAAVAMGNGANAGAANAVAIGNGANAGAANSAAIGNGANASAANAVAIGSGSVANVANTVSVGAAGSERRITNVAAGINPTDAATVSQLSSTASGFQSQLAGVQSQLQGQIYGLHTQIDANRNEARRGIAATAALAPAIMPSAPGKFTMSVNGGVFQDAYGVGLGVAYRLRTQMPAVVYGSYSNAGGNEHVGRAGLAVEF